MWPGRAARPCADMTALRMSHSSRPMRLPVGQHRRRQILRRLGEHADDVVDHLVAEVRALGPRHRKAFGEIAAGQRGHVVAVEHARAPTAQDHEPDDRIDQQFVPRRGEERRVQFDGHVGAAEQFGEPSRGVGVRQHQSCPGAQPHPTTRLRFRRDPYRGGHDRGSWAEWSNPFDLLDAVLQRAHHRSLVAQPRQPAGGAPRSGCPSPQATPRRRDQRPRWGPCAPAPAPQWGPRRPGAPRWSRAACARTTGRDDRPHAGMPRQSSRSRQVRSVQRFHPRTPSYRRFRSHYTVAVLSSGLSQGDFWCCAVMPQVRCGPPMPVRR